MTNPIHPQPRPSLSSENTKAVSDGIASMSTLPKTAPPEDSSENPKKNYMSMIVHKIMSVFSSPSKPPENIDLDTPVEAPTGGGEACGIFLGVALIGGLLAIIFVCLGINHA